MKQPIQQLVDVNGVLRFRANEIVRFLLDKGPFDLNSLVREEFSREDWEQFAMLIGYSFAGFGDLGYVSDETYEAARLLAEGSESEKDERIKFLEEKLRVVQEGMRAPVAALFDMHPEDVGGFYG